MRYAGSRGAYQSCKKRLLLASRIFYIGWVVVFFMFLVSAMLSIQTITFRRIIPHATFGGCSAFTPNARRANQKRMNEPRHLFPTRRLLTYARAFPQSHTWYGHQYPPIVYSITSLGAAKRDTSSYNDRPLVIQGPPGFVVPKNGKKTKRPFKLVVVESPSKCQTISKILQQYVTENSLDHDFVITSSMGHIRNIPKTKAFKGQKIAGIDLENNYEPTYQVIEGKENMLLQLQELSASTTQLILATDDDREGEAMAWHLLQLLEGEENPFLLESKVPHDRPLRVRFTEITKKAIIDAIEHPETSLQDNLVEAQQARRILDRLAGFTVSPILWKKIAPGLSAGRVQSVGMAMTVQRERERLLFQETEYWSVKGNFSASDNPQTDRLMETQLISIDGQAIASGTADFEPREANRLTLSSQNKIHLTETLATDLTTKIETQGEQWLWNIEKVSSSQRRQSPPIPFITSSLQQEANRRLGLSVSQSMRSAQQLYEKGFISYMRTDSTHLSEDARGAIKEEIVHEFGGVDNYDPEMVNRGKKSTKSKSTKDNKPDPQAAHEAIRPAVRENGRFMKPENLPKDFDAAALGVYKLIYQRTVASHMTPQVSNQTSISISGIMNDEDETELIFRTSGSVVIDPGFTSAYPRQVDSKSPILPFFEEGQSLLCDDVKGLAHTTQPPARYTEASFIQELESQGVGRPSTYASTVQSLRDRFYVGSPTTGDFSGRGPAKEVSGPAISAQRAAGGEDFSGARSARGPLVPSLSAFVVTSLLEKYCNMYVDPTFTAKMEERLDKIAKSEVSENERVSYLDEFYRGDEGLASKIDHIEKFVDADVARRADLPALPWNSTDSEDIGLFIGPYGPYVKKISTSNSESQEDNVVTASLPPAMASDISTITLEGLNTLLQTKAKDGQILGHHPDDGKIVRLKLGPYGAYLQRGEDEDEETTRHTLPRKYRIVKTSDVDNNDYAEGEVSLANMIGLSFEEAVQYTNLPRTVCYIDELPIVAAIGPYGPYLKYNGKFTSLKPKDGDVLTIDADLAQQLVQQSKGSTGVLAEIGEKDGAMITVKSGRFGEYINWNKVNAKLPSEYYDDPSDLPLEEAWSLIQEKAASTQPKSKKKKSDDVELPPGPKRPQSSYLIFTSEKRNEVSKNFSSLGEVSKELGRLWNELSEDEKKPYIEKAAAAKIVYEEELAKWKESTKHLLKSKKGKASTKGSSKDGPKRPRSAYIFFCNANREEVSKDFKTLGEISKELGRRWNDLDADGKAEYQRLSDDDKQRYVKEMDELPSSLSISTSESNSNKVASKKKARKKKKTKRPPSAYMLFCASHREQVLDDHGNKLSLPETTKILAQMWRECDDETRARFVEEAGNQKIALK